MTRRVAIGYSESMIQNNETKRFTVRTKTSKTTVGIFEARDALEAVVEASERLGPSLDTYVQALSIRAFKEGLEAVEVSQ
jgi:hypothetical protein